MKRLRRSPADRFIRFIAGNERASTSPIGPSSLATASYRIPEPAEKLTKIPVGAGSRLYIAQGASELQSRLSGVTDPDQFLELPVAFSLESAERPMALLREIRAGLLERVEELKPTGHTLSIELAETELKRITEAYRTLDNLFEGFRAE